MLEWYRTECDYTHIMNDVETLFLELAKTTQKHIPYFSSWNRVSMKELWQTYVGINLDEYLTQEALLHLCIKKGFSPLKQESFEDLFFRIFLNYIEPELGKDAPTIVYEYPAQMAALAKLSDKDNRYAERFEVYYQGAELANGFNELSAEKEQRLRFETDNRKRDEHGLPTKPIDENFLSALDAGLPACAGVALGIDRLLMLKINAKHIQEVINFTVSRA